MPPTPFSASYSEEEVLLSPPKVRSPYTPPPQHDEDITQDQRPLGHREEDMNGHTEVDMKSLRLDNVEASAGHKSKRKQRKNSGPKSLAGLLRRGIVDHQLGLSLNAILLVGMSWCLFPSLRERLEALFTLSYKVRGTGSDVETLYGQGPRDLWLVASLVVVFTGVRAFMLDHVLVPLGGMMGIQKRKGKVR